MLSIKNRLIVITILSALGIVVSGYSLKLHYSIGSSSFCNFNSTINCDAVNHSWASEIAGVPVALMGIIGYALLLLGGFWLLVIKKITNFTWGAMALASLFGLGFSLFLTGVEIFSLRAYCLFCVTSQLLMLIIAWLIWKTSVARQGLRSWFFQ
ncbi:MAG: hypothetical protein COT26_01285 [Candidatus Kerfeldbacteria bacterium CG08_land_8_20_14_0_20_43_14]|uniref:Vitamin K epoxide reductase domain-containing protein n=1 Tax=Candidatus Kerfeldbacteria bacterium CG08_land_8_20_14_0_20_43_14 TaxID=2014246 RepID=A0A2H0YQP5_9BACT|nr:MAG: hypothetical protein COT26_01285 [Candidatus Kerfeldbacteria bacterium CG08_land_8_20_14_0_20_43_14]